ncbi:transmembrane protein 268 [Agrobacterium vitis]|uniref:transmembrane protein 268 n=1 Tax=Agrobacterium vitis TaxID=373 RepID=UPI001C988D4A|nr:transmembrane protein 268 [Agrobacterium vitis]QZO04568.1 transmembrane protein 268 [Agrobacterium vitis]UJL86711.1 hypothetical protein AVF2S5_01455 [Agrobacterium vitis]
MTSSALLLNEFWAFVLLISTALVSPKLTAAFIAIPARSRAEQILKNLQAFQKPQT